MRVHHVIADVAGAHVAHNHADARVGGGAHPRGGVLHGDAITDVRILRLGCQQVDGGVWLEARWVKVALPAVDLLRAEPGVEAGGDDGDGDAGLTTGGSNRKLEPHVSKTLQRFLDARATRGDGLQRQHGVILLLDEEVFRLAVAASHCGKGLQPKPGASLVHKFQQSWILALGGAHFLKRRQPNLGAGFVALVHHELKRLAGIFADELQHVGLREVRHLYVREVRRQLPKGDLHGGCLGVAEGAIKVEEDSGRLHSDSRVEHSVRHAS
mmetsp:Transcript_18055/g.32150  ORF Transcript_18055/g.32150 Transcript_18055/m.32150 type:complete len:269 (-) Transcript_18055:298-1104(-)